MPPRRASPELSPYQKILQSKILEESRKRRILAEKKNEEAMKLLNEVIEKSEKERAIILKKSEELQAQIPKGFFW
jgi:sugar-specific transcriptional regulator TrmB